MRMTRTRDMLSRRMRDGRNPYGSRGGYVVSDKARGEYDRNRMGDYARNPEYRTGYTDMSYSRPMYERNRDYGERDYEYDRDYNSRRLGSFDYNTYDYASGDYRLTPKELRTWERKLENDDGTRGAKFTEEQVMQVAQGMGIKFDEFSPELLTTLTNVMYSDYSRAENTNDIAQYVRLAKSFLCDDDFDGTPEEKAYLYYKAIVEDDDRF